MAAHCTLVKVAPLHHPPPSPQILLSSGRASCAGSTTCRDSTPQTERGRFCLPRDIMSGQKEDGLYCQSTTETDENPWSLIRVRQTLHHDIVIPSFDASCLLPPPAASHPAWIPPPPLSNKPIPSQPPWANAPAPDACWLFPLALRGIVYRLTIVGLGASAVIIT